MSSIGQLIAIYKNGLLWNKINYRLKWSTENLLSPEWSANNVGYNVDLQGTTPPPNPSSPALCLL